MKKSIPALIALCLAVSGCGSVSPQTGESITYKFEDLSAQTEIYRHYNDILLKANITKNNDITIPELTEENKDRYSKTLKRIMDVDIDKSLAEMDDITDIIYAVNNDNKRVYRDKEHPEAMILSNGGDLTLLYEMHETAEEYRPFIDDICRSTGLMYCGMTLGREFDDLNTNIATQEEKDINGYTGRNMIAFANTEYIVHSAAQEYYGGESYRSLPLRINFYMEKDEIKYVNIYYLNNENTCSLTAENLKQLSFSPTAGNLMTGLCFAVKDTAGERDGIKYTLSLNAGSGWNDMKYNVLSLKY